MSQYETQGISITTQCYDCMQLDDKCDACYEQKEAIDATIAWEIVDDGNMQYTFIMPIYLKKEPSGHDWTERDNEFLEPIVKLQDGGVHEELWELEDYTQRQREKECRWCHILTPKVFNDCQSCDKPLENNIIA